MKLTAWSALVVGLVLALCGTGTALFIQHEQIESLDDQLRNEAEVYFGELRQRGSDIDWSQRPQVKQMLPITRTERFVEITNSQGERLYTSRNLKAQKLTSIEPGMHSVQIGSQRTRLGVFSQDGITLRLAVDLNEINRDTQEFVLAFALGLPCLLVMLAAGGWWLARKALAPIQEITTAAQQITAEHLSQRLPISPVRDEIGHLANVLNDMFDRLDVSFRQAARFSADASHELKTPLTVLRAGIEDLLESPALVDADRRAVAALLEQTRRLSSITDSLLLLSRADAGRLHLDLRPAGLGEIILACVEDARIIAEPRAISIETRLAEPLRAPVDSGRLGQILLNLLDNAVKYNHPGGFVRISAAAMKNGGVLIVVGNTGPGIPPKDAPHLFERFFRSDPAAGIPGHGLGLSLARELARAHGGELELKRSGRGWTEFHLTIGPVVPSPNPEADNGSHHPNEEPRAQARRSLV